MAIQAIMSNIMQATIISKRISSIQSSINQYCFIISQKANAGFQGNSFGIEKDISKVVLAELFALCFKELQSLLTLSEVNLMD